MDLDFVLVHKHELGQYPAILTSHLVNNPYLMPYFNYFSPVLSDKLQKLQNGAARIHEEGFSRKTSASFRVQKIYEHVMPSQRDMSTPTPPANKITEPLAFTVCQVELRSKAIMLQSHFRHTSLRPVVNNNWQNRRRVTCIKMKRTQGAIPKAWLQRGSLDGHEIWNWKYLI